jgi:hypothetical protein
MSSVDKSSSSPAENPSILTGRNWFERLLISFIASLDGFAGRFAFNDRDREVQNYIKFSPSTRD